MKKFLHYTVCLFNILHSFLRKTLFVWTRNHFFAFFCFFKCVCLLIKKPTTPMPHYALEDYYPDPGKLSETKGYRHNPDLDLSVIIPLYNVEKYIEECLDSILTQKIDYTYEIILVDDGSTDKTAKLVEPYLKDNIKLICQQNSGQSVARNRALYESHGKYIMFVDGDDVLLPDAIQNLMDAAIKNCADIAEGNVIWFNDEIPEHVIEDGKTKPHIESYNKKPKFVLSCNGYSVAKVYKRELWETVRFPENYIFEDTITRYILRRKANMVVFTGVPVYAYRRNPSSSTHSGMTLKMLDSLWVFTKYIEMCKEQNMPFDKAFYTMAISDLALNIVVMKIEDETLKLACFEKLCKEFRKIQKYKCGRLPIALKLSEKALKKGNMNAWQYNAETIIKYGLIKAYREG